MPSDLEYFWPEKRTRKLYFHPAQKLLPSWGSNISYFTWTQINLFSCILYHDFRKHEKIKSTKNKFYVLCSEIRNRLVRNWSGFCTISKINHHEKKHLLKSYKMCFIYFKFDNVLSSLGLSIEW